VTNNNQNPAFNIARLNIPPAISPAPTIQVRAISAGSGTSEVLAAKNVSGRHPTKF
jgi:hypothetical protein